MDKTVEAIATAREMIKKSGRRDAAALDQSLERLAATLVPWSAATIEQYKVIEARRDRLSSIQFGLWTTGVAALGVFTALKGTINPPALLWSIGFIGSLFTILGRQCAIAERTHRWQLHRLFSKTGVPPDQHYSLFEPTGIDRPRIIGELFVWPLALVAALAIGTWWGFHLEALKWNGLGLGAIIAAILVSGALLAQAIRWRDSEKRYRDRPKDI